MTDLTVEVVCCMDTHKPMASCAICGGGEGTYTAQLVPGSIAALKIAYADAMVIGSDTERQAEAFQKLWQALDDADLWEANDG